MPDKKDTLPQNDVNDVAGVEENVSNDAPQQPQAVKPSLAQKTKQAFADLGKKIKGVFVKDQVALIRDAGNTVITAEMLAGPQLSRKEKFSRFLHSQSGWLFVLPAVLLMCIFTFYPIINAFVGSFRQNYQATTGRFDGFGFENFVRVLKGDTGTGGATFLQCLVNTLVFTLVSVPLSTLIALLISVALNSIKPLQKAYQTVLFLPYLTNSLAMGAVFATFFTIIGTKSNPETPGLVNLALQAFGIAPVDWMGIGSPTWELGAISIPWAKYIVVIVYEVWSGLPFKILILFSALQSVNKQYYDAAKIDGASRSTILWKITAPMISPMISYLLITGIMGGMKQYSSIVGLFGEQMGIDYDMGTMVGYIYRYIEDGYTGYAFAGSLMLFAIIMVITAISNRISKKRVTY